MYSAMHKQQSHIAKNVAIMITISFIEDNDLASRDQNIPVIKRPAIQHNKALLIQSKAFEYSKR